MWSWGKSNSEEPFIVSIPNLKKYHEILSRKDQDYKLEPGDYIELKQEPFLAKKYAGCSSNPEDENFHAYLLVYTTSNYRKHTRLGSCDDIIIVVVSKGEVISKAADSRLFQKSKIIKSCPAVTLLKEFVDDKPVTEVTEGMLVRPRANTCIKGYHSKISSFSIDSVFKVPLYVLGIDSKNPAFSTEQTSVRLLDDTIGSNGDKIILAGYIDSEHIQEIHINRHFLCLYS